MAQMAPSKLRRKQYAMLESIIDSSKLVVNSNYKPGLGCSDN